MRTTIYDLNDNPIATIDDDEINTIRLYNGHAVGYLVETIISGWNGNALGEIKGSAVVNTSGQVIGKLTSEKYTLPPYRPLSDYSTGIRTLYKHGTQRTNPINPVNDPNSLEEVLRSGGSYVIPPLKIPNSHPPTTN